MYDNWAYSKVDDIRMYLLKYRLIWYVLTMQSIIASNGCKNYYWSDDDDDDSEGKWKSLSTKTKYNKGSNLSSQTDEEKTPIEQQFAMIFSAW